MIDADAGRITGPISPYIYGLAAATPEHYRQLRIKLVRWGGNPSTRYNWQRGNCWNTARDWFFENVNYNARAPADRKPSGVADQAVLKNSRYGADTLLTIPTLGWVARDDNPLHASKGVPVQGGPPLTPGSAQIRGYDPTANQGRVSVPSYARKNRPFEDPPDPAAAAVYQDEWVNHLVRRFGRADAGGVRFYAMDNEPDLWDTTHTDMHPVATDYDEMLQRFLSYATAVKDVDPTAQVTGPVSWGWTGYFFSARDRGNDRFATHADRRAHGNTAFIPWFLQQVAKHDAIAGRRTLDVLDVHYYPQGVGIYSSRIDAETDARRLRSPRALWDASYIDESWVDAAVLLIPRLRQWVEHNYPGTKIAITEWNCGAEQHISGGLAVAEVLGIFGREHLDLACYWTSPKPGSPAFLAYKLYRNADNLGNGFGDRSIRASSSDPDTVSCYGAIDTRGNRPTLMLINKSLEHAHRIKLMLAHWPKNDVAARYQLAGAYPSAIQSQPEFTLADGQAEITLPPASATLLVSHRGVP